MKMYVSVYIGKRVCERERETVYETVGVYE